MQDTEKKLKEVKLSIKSKMTGRNEQKDEESEDDEMQAVSIFHTGIQTLSASIMSITLNFY